MAITSRNIKCPDCNVFTADADYCKNCGALISYQKKEEIRAEVIQQEIVTEEKWKLEHPNKVAQLKNHPFWLYRGVGYVLYSVIFVVSIIGSAIAWIIAMLAAG